MRKYLSILIIGLILPIFLTSCWKKATPPTEEVVQETVENSPYTLEQLETMFAEEEKKEFVPQSESVDVIDISNYLSSGQKNIKDLIASLSWSDTESVEKRAYLKSFMGDYSWALADREDLCKTDNTQCKKESITIEFSQIADQSGSIVSAPNIYLNSTKLDTQSAVLQAEVYDNMIHRVRVEKEWYLDAFAKINGVEWVPLELKINSTMSKAALAIQMDNQVGGTYTVGTWTNSIMYIIPPNTFSYEDGKIVNGIVNVYLFSLWYQDQDLSVFALDTFSPDGINMGSSMVTDWMPFVSAYSDGKELIITKEIEGEGMMEMNQTFTLNLEDVPKNQWLNNETLIEYWLPGYWRLDRKNGVWIESEMQILNTEWRYRFKFQ